MSVVDLNNLKPLNIKKTKGKFKIFTNGSIIPESKFQPYLGKELIINIDKILSIYPSEDNIGTMIHAENGQSTWKVLENIETVVKRVNE
jgi:hypothetical protein